jgi:hypothetical protein
MHNLQKAQDPVQQRTPLQPLHPRPKRHNMHLRRPSTPRHSSAPIRPRIFTPRGRRHRPQLQDLHRLASVPIFRDFSGQLLS